MEKKHSPELQAAAMILIYESLIACEVKLRFPRSIHPLLLSSVEPIILSSILMSLYPFFKSLMKAAAANYL
jgi:hypothetical protein